MSDEQSPSENGHMPAEPLEPLTFQAAGDLLRAASVNVGIVFAHVNDTELDDQLANVLLVLGMAVGRADELLKAEEAGQ